MAGAGSELPTHASLRSARVDLPLAPFVGATSGFVALPGQIFPHRSLSLTVCKIMAGAGSEPAISA